MHNSEDFNENSFNQSYHEFKTNYTILNELGRGAFSTVYKVRSNHTGKIYCVKKIRIHNKLSKSQENEIQILEKLSKSQNPNKNHLVQYYNNYKDNDNLYIIMEYCEYGDIYSLLRSVKKHHIYIQEDILWDIAYQSLLGLDFLHSLNIIHRDIKLLNIFMTKDKIVKIGDMGMSKLIQDDINMMNMSRVGTPLFLAPELVKKEKYDYKVDVWSLGCSLYHLAKLLPPFNEENLIRLGNSIVNDKPADLPNHYSEEFKRLVNAMLIKDKNKRVSAREAIEKYIPDKVKKKYREKNEIKDEEVTFNKKNTVLNKRESEKGKEIKASQIEKLSKPGSQKKLSIIAKNEKENKKIDEDKKIENKDIALKSKTFQFHIPNNQMGTTGSHFKRNFKFKLPQKKESLSNNQRYNLNTFYSNNLYATQDAFQKVQQIKTPIVQDNKLNKSHKIQTVDNFYNMNAGILKLNFARKKSTEITQLKCENLIFPKILKNTIMANKLALKKNEYAPSPNEMRKTFTQKNKTALTIFDLK